jgi:ribosomal protein L37AE/L43A
MGDHKDAVIPSDLMKLVTMTTLQTRVSELGVCPYCHSRTLDRRRTDESLAWDQCRACLRVFVIADPLKPL